MTRIQKSTIKPDYTGIFAQYLSLFALKSFLFFKYLILFVLVSVYCCKLFLFAHIVFMPVSKSNTSTSPTKLDAVSYYRANAPKRTALQGGLVTWKLVLVEIIRDGLTLQETLDWMKKHHHALGYLLPSEKTVPGWLAKLRKENNLSLRIRSATPSARSTKRSIPATVHPARRHPVSAPFEPEIDSKSGYPDTAKILEQEGTPAAPPPVQIPIARPRKTAKSLPHVGQDLET